MEMQNILSNNSELVENDTMLEGNKYYCKLKKELLVSRKLDSGFELQNNFWKVSAFLFAKSFDVYAFCLTIDDNLYNLQAGIVDDDKNELATLNATKYHLQKSSFQMKELIGSTEIESLLLANKVIYLFLEIKRTKNIETDYEELFRNGKNSDVTIKVKRRKFNCHKCILAARSPVFAAMIEHDMKKKASGVVTIKDSEPTTFQEFLLYLYTGSKSHLNWKNVINMYELANKYLVEDLKNLCSDVIKENLTTENFCEYFHLAQLHNDPELIDATIQFFLEKSKDITESEKWLLFLSNNPIESNVLIKALAHKCYTKTNTT